MERANVVKDEIVEENRHFMVVYVETVNSCLVLLSEGQDKLGTLAVAVPSPKDLLGGASSSILVGDRNTATARMFAEYLAELKAKISLVSIYLESVTEMQAQSVFSRLVQRIAKHEKTKESIPV